MIQQTSLISVTSKQLSDYIVDDSSSLGYGSGHSSTYSTSRFASSCECTLDDFYRDAEFYDLDSVDTLVVNNDDHKISTKCSDKAQLKSKNIFPHCSLDIDEVEPSEQFRINDRSSTKLLTLSESNFSHLKHETTVFDYHIYEEIIHDSLTINLNGIRPPPLPKRNKIRSVINSQST